MSAAAALQLKADRIDWAAPPNWARIEEGNPMIVWPRISAAELAAAREAAQPAPRASSFTRRGL